MLEAEFRRRCARNPRFSLRAFARQLGSHHATLSAVLSGRRRLTPRAIRQLGTRLGLSQVQLDDACLAENAGIVLSLVADPRFRADSRWLAMMTGVPLDDVNRALHFLLHRRVLTMRATNLWTREID